MVAVGNFGAKHKLKRVFGDNVTFSGIEIFLLEIGSYSSVQPSGKEKQT